MSLLKRIADAKLTRREFLAGTAVATASLALVGCKDGETNLKETDSTNQKETEAPSSEVSTVATMTISDTDQKIMNGEGKWISAACWHNCGGRCLNKAYVVDGIVLRQKTDDKEGDGFDNPQQRGCPRGHSQRQQVLGADRLKYPMKRKNWSPENPNGHLRGCDEWERISWDEALNYVASELKRIKENYGNRSIYAPGGDEIYRTLTHFGGYVGSWCSSSVGAWQYAADCGVAFIGSNGNDKYNLEESDVFFMLGCNPAWSSMGPSGVYWKHFRDMGKRFVAVDPFYNDSYSMMGAEWVPIHPNADQALLFGIAYEMLKLDETKGDIVDWEFLNTYTIGFDADHMPEGEDPKDNFKDYVLGTYDGVPKDAAWASLRTGVAEEKVRELAELLGKKTKLAFLFSWANARATNAENLPQLYMTLAAMGGHIGRKGHCFSACNNQWSGTGWDPMDPVMAMGDRGLPALTNPVDDLFCDATVWEDILNKKYVSNCTNLAYAYTSNPLVRVGTERDIDIRMIYFGGLNGWSVGQETSNLQTKLNMSKGIEAVRKMEFVVTNAYTYTTSARYSDIVLPVTTWWEKLGMLTNGHKESLIVYQQVIEPLYEAQSDYWIARELAKRLDLDPDVVYPIDLKQQYFNQLTGTMIKNAQGAYEPIIAVTDEDIAEWGVTGTARPGLIPLKEIMEKGIWQLERKPGDAYMRVGYEDYIKDPVANPRGTASGKFEIFCASYRDGFKVMGVSNGPTSAIPKYVAAEEGYEGTFSDWDNQVKGKYTFQVITPHYPRRSHSTMDNVPWLRKAFAHPVYISTADAKAKGIANGDTVLISNDRGKVLRLATVTNRLMPGTIILPHGGWVDVDEETGIDRGGADNYLSGAKPSPNGVVAWNSCLVDIEKYNGKPLVPDVEKPPVVLFD